MLQELPLPTDRAEYVTRDALRLRGQLANDTTTDSAGVLHWKTNGRPVPLHCFREAFVIAPAGQAAACEASDRAAIAEYIKHNRKRRLTAEERYEMRAAHGPGVTVVDVFTGRKFRT